MKTKKNQTAISRRSFLKVTAGAAVVSSIGLPKKALAAKEAQIATLIDLNLCDGCADRKIPACVSACKEINRDKIPQVIDPIPEPWPRKTILVEKARSFPSPHAVQFHLRSQGGR